MDMTDDRTSPEPPLPEPITLRVDRSKALVRGLWRLGIAGCCFWLLYVWDVRWEILWNTQTATFFGLGMLYLGLAAIALALLFPGLKWLLLMGWPGRLAIEITTRHVRFNLGPYGRADLDMERVSVTPDREIDSDMLELMPDDAFMTCMRHPAFDGDLGERIQVFSGIESERLNGLLRPYLVWKMGSI